MKIPFYNIDRIYKGHEKEILKITGEIFSEGKVIEGKAVEELENNLKKLCGRKYAFAVNSCTDALYFSLLAAGIGPGDEVIVPALSFVASASPVVRAGAKVVFADVTPDGNIDLKDASKHVCKNTKAIIPVHLYGKMINPAELYAFAEEHKLIIIEDAAQALSSRYGNIPAGNTGFSSCFSFDPSKIIGAFGTGGAVLCDDDAAAAKIKIWRGQGRNNTTGSFDQPGYNSRLSTVQAALINLQLQGIDSIIASRNAIAEKFNKSLSTLPLFLPVISENVCNFHKYHIRTKLRDKLKNFLAEKGIETAVHYPYILPGQPVFGKCEGNFPVAAQISDTSLSLPIYPELTKEETDYICTQVSEFFKSNPQ